MTLPEIMESSKAVLTAEDIAPVLGASAQHIRLCAKQCPEQLGFPVTVLGSRVKIPRKPFLEYLGENDVS